MDDEKREQFPQPKWMKRALAEEKKYIGDLMAPFSDRAHGLLGRKARGSAACAWYRGQQKGYEEGYKKGYRDGKAGKKPEKFE